jgi:CelD/BcsL family acetyltransferase involved in cellulose biosynthesis
VIPSHSEPSVPPRATEVSTATSLEEVERLRPLWTRLQGASLHSDIDYFSTVAKHNPAVIRPHVVVVHPNGGEPSLLATHLAHRAVGHRLGPWVPYEPRLTVLNFFRGIVGNPSTAELEAAFASLGNELGNGADALLLRNVDLESPLREVTARVFPASQHQRWMPPKLRWETTVDRDPTAAFEWLSSSTRASVRRAERRLVRAFGDTVETRIYSTPADAETLFRSVDAVAERTYQTEGRPIFRHDELLRRLVELGLEKGWFRAYVLYVGARPVAFWTGFVYGGVFGWRGATGYDPDFRSYSVGRHLLMMMLEHLAGDPDVQRVTLGVGDLPYKRSVSDPGDSVADVRIFASTVRGRWVNAVGSAVHGANAVVRSTRAVPALGRRLDALDEWLERRERRLPR